MIMSSHPSLVMTLSQRMISRPYISLLQFNALVAAWLALFLNFHFFSNINQLSSYHGAPALLFLAAVGFILFCIYFLVIHLLSWRFTAKAVALTLIVIGGCSAYFVNELGIDINTGQITNLMQTDSREVLDLMCWI